MKPTLSEILAVFNDPQTAPLVYTPSLFEIDFNAYLSTNNLSPQSTVLKQFSIQQVQNFIEALNLPDIQALLAELNSRLAALPFLDYSSFTLSSDLPTYSEVQNTLQAIHKEITTTSALREECNHYTTLLKSMSDLLQSFKKAMESFITDETIRIQDFAHLSERKRLAERVIADLEPYAIRVTSLRTTLNTAYDNILGQRQNLLMRSDSAIRLLVNKSDEQSRLPNFFQSRHKTTAPTSTDLDDSGFEITHIRSQR